jgi:hypothetical protein
MFSIFRRNKKKKEEALKSKPIPPSFAPSGYVPSSSSSYTQPVSHVDDVMSNIFHPANPFNPAYSTYSDPSPSSSDNSCSYDSSSSSYDSGSSSSYDSGSSSSSSCD